MAIKGPLGFKLKFAYGIGQAGEGLKTPVYVRVHYSAVRVLLLPVQSDG